MASKAGKLSETLLEPSSKIAATLKTSGRYSTLVTNEEDKALYYLKGHSFGFHWKGELYAGAEAEGQPLYYFKERCSFSCKIPVRISNGGQEVLTDLNRTKVFKASRAFTFDGVEYEWKQKRGCWRTKRYQLVEVKSSIVLAEFEGGGLKGQGTVTIYETELRVPQDLIVGTALVTQRMKLRYSGASRVSSTGAVV